MQVTRVSPSLQAAQCRHAEGSSQGQAMFWHLWQPAGKARRWRLASLRLAVADLRV